MSDVYVSPLSARYAGPEMSRLFSAQFKGETFRALWIALAKAQAKLGLSITQSQIDQMIAAQTHLDFQLIQRYEKQFRHDVMAHIHAFGDACPLAKPIIHLGATSSYVNDNAELIQLKEALALLFNKLLHLLHRLSALARQHASEPCLGYTHFQPAQPTTIGKRIALWLQDFLWDAKEWRRIGSEMPFLGAKGATGTQSSFLALFEGNHRKVHDLEQDIARSFGFTKVLPLSGQTYPRKLDTFLLNALASFAASAHKFATDLRLLAHEGEVLEPFSTTQVGSSAMPYKRNPIYSERICGLARFAISLSENASYTAATQWLERSLDDSSNRRLAIPEAFLSIDAVLNLMHHILEAPDIDAKSSKRHAQEALPLLCMENILMEAVKRGASRQDMHETLRKLAELTKKAQDPMEELLKALASGSQALFSRSEILAFGDLKQLVGRAPEQTLEFLASEVDPFLRQHPAVSVIFAPIEY